KIAATIISEIGEIDRFNDAKKLVAFAGVDPSVFSSGKFTASVVDVKSNFTLFARFLFTLLPKKCFFGFSCDDFPRFHNHGLLP
ncbi:IS110 family transposase, partial [Cytobacillus oceanisediminis]|uniref:IS110 family transposase n=1 Tax=Cytobacillus oceanisediminis TaxID=665099 RepID=UPI002041E18A